jgi:hypothetical protein
MVHQPRISVFESPCSRQLFLILTCLALLIGAGPVSSLAAAPQKEPSNKAGAKHAVSQAKVETPPATEDDSQVELVDLTYVHSAVKPTGNDTASQPAGPKATAKAVTDSGSSDKGQGSKDAAADPGAGQGSPATPTAQDASAATAGDSVDQLVKALNVMFPGDPKKAPATAAPKAGGAVPAVSLYVVNAGGGPPFDPTKVVPAAAQGGSGDGGKKSGAAGTDKTDAASAGPAVERAGRHSILMRGSLKQRRQIRQILDRTDMPWPQVQLDMWAVQVSGDADHVGKATKRIAEAIGSTRDKMVSLQRHLSHLAAAGLQEKPSEKLCVAPKGGVDFPVEEPLSLNEALILLLLREDRGAAIKELEALVAEDWKRVHPDAKQQAFHRLGEALAIAIEAEPATYPMAQEMAHKAYCHRFDTFLDSYSKAQGDLRAGYRGARSEVGGAGYLAERGHAAALKRNSARIDRLLKSLVDAFVADVDELYFYPLLDEIRNEGKSDRIANEVALTGRAHMVVTSGMESDLDPEMAFFVDNSRPKPFGQNLLDLAFGSDSSSGTGKFLATLPQGKAVLLAGALLSEPEPHYAKVAPGVSVHVRPTVLPDGSAARLTIDARFGVTTADYDPKNQDTSNLWLQPPPPGISSHRVETDAVVSAFDLFGISSFSFDTVIPRGPFVVPILGQLPIIGRIFQFPQANTDVRHESIILVNVAILPRALSLMQYYDNYGEDQDNHANPPAAVSTSAEVPKQ